METKPTPSDCSFSVQEARQFFPEVLTSTRAALSAAACVQKSVLPAGEKEYATLRDAQPEVVPAEVFLRLSGFKTAPPEVRALAVQASLGQVSVLRALVWPLVQAWRPRDEAYPHGIDPRRGFTYYRGERDYRVLWPVVWEAVLECLACDWQLARVALSCPPQAQRDVGVFARYLRKFALADSHGFQGHEDDHHEQQTPLPDDVDGLPVAAPTIEDDVVLADGGALQAVKVELLLRFQERFPIKGVKLDVQQAALAFDLYLQGMAQCAADGADPSSGWGRLRLPRGYVKDHVWPALGLPEHQESRLRRAFEAILDELRRERAD